MKDKYLGFATYNSLLRGQINEFLKIELKAVGRSELKPSYGTLLALVYRNDGKVQIKTAYDTILKQKSTITEMINRMVKLGYLEKVRCNEDKRVSFIVATKKALDFQDDFNQISKKLMDRLFDGFTDDEKLQFTALMLKAIDNFT